jgi:regulator of ribonuclease activity B
LKDGDGGFFLMNFFNFFSKIKKTETNESRTSREVLDKQVLNELRRVGSNFAKPHDLEHHFVVYNDSIINFLTDELKSNGYSISQIGQLNDSNGVNYLFFDAIKPTLLKEQIIFNESSYMTVLAKKYAVLYDGWGTGVVN